VQAKLTIGQPGDRYEQEADRVARDVVQRINSPVSETPQPENSLQRQTEPEAEKLQMKPMLQRFHAVGGEDATPDLESSINRARGGGQPLDAGLQRSMGQAMGADFSGVRVHTDTQSDQLNQSIQAKAFTTGQDVFFRSGEYNPGSKAGQELIAHELTHVVQQNGSQVQPKIDISQINLSTEQEKLQAMLGSDTLQTKKTKTSRTLNFITMKRKHIALTGEDKYGHWWTEVDGGESYGWWPKYSVSGLWETLTGVEGELNGITSFGGTATKDPHHGDSANDDFHPELTNSKTDTQVKSEIRSFASSYSGEWRWTFGWGQNCHTFQKSLMSKVGLVEP
jgi:hypothetical protein